MFRVADRGAVFYEFEQWAGARNGLAHGVFTRLGGVSESPWQSLNVGSTVGDDPAAIAENKARMYHALDVDGSRAYTVYQVHSADTVIATEPRDPLQPLVEADGIVTDRPGLALTMRFADCVPILFYDPLKHVAAIAHAGWRGTVAGAGPATARTMIEAFGCQPEDIQAGIGPSIGPERYQVGEEVVEAYHQVFSGVTGLVKRAVDGSAYLNLWEANRRSLVALGLRQIEVAQLCTASHTDEFYSHRAEQGRTGRFGAVIALR